MLLLICLKLKKIIGKRGSDGAKNVEVIVPWKYLSNFWGSLEMPLIYCEISHDLSWSEKCVKAGQGARFSITDTKALCSSCDFINSR